MVQALAGSLPQEPGRIIGANGNHGQIKGPKALADLLEYRAPASVSSKPDSLGWALDTVPSPQRVPPVPQTSGAPVLHAHLSSSGLE